MIHTTIKLPIHKEVFNNNFCASITTYILPNNQETDMKRTRPFVLVIPGGAYWFRSERESEPVAIQMNQLGFQSAVLNYSIKPMDFPAAFLDVCEAVHCIREHAAEWAVDPNKIIIAGFSAGGHLAASYGVFWNTGLAQKYLSYSAEDLRPNGLLLCYPVITAGEKAHRDSINFVVGNSCAKDFPMLKTPKTDFTNTTRIDDVNVSPAECDMVSLEKHVNTDVPPVFMWHTYEDQDVPVENTFMFASELKKLNIPLELHIFAHGIHGISLATPETSGHAEQIHPECAVWPSMFASWLKSL